MQQTCIVAKLENEIQAKRNAEQKMNNPELICDRTAVTIKCTLTRCVGFSLPTRRVTTNTTPNAKKKNKRQTDNQNENVHKTFVQETIACGCSTFGVPICFFSILVLFHAHCVCIL